MDPLAFDLQLLRLDACLFTIQFQRLIKEGWFVLCSWDAKEAHTMETSPLSLVAIRYVQVTKTVVQLHGSVKHQLFKTFKKKRSKNWAKYQVWEGTLFQAVHSWRYWIKKGKTKQGKGITIIIMAGAREFGNPSFFLLHSNSWWNSPSFFYSWYSRCPFL